MAHFKCPKPTGPLDTLWAPALNPWFKINTDVAIFKNLKTMGIGTMIRDLARIVIVPFNRHLHLPLGPLEVEAKAMDVAVSFAWDISIHDVVFETDSHVIFTILLSSTTPPATIIDVAESRQK